MVNTITERYMHVLCITSVIITKLERHLFLLLFITMTMDICLEINKESKNLTEIFGNISCFTPKKVSGITHWKSYAA